MKPNRAGLIGELEPAHGNDIERVTRRPPSLSAEERLERSLQRIERLRAELRFEAAVLEIERLAGKLSREP